VQPPLSNDWTGINSDKLGLRLIKDFDKNTSKGYPMQLTARPLRLGEFFLKKGPMNKGYNGQWTNLGQNIWTIKT